DLGGFSHPHTYVRLPNEHLLATFQYKADSATTATPSHAHGASPTDAPHTTGGLVQMGERGTGVRSGTAHHSAIPHPSTRPHPRRGARAVHAQRHGRGGQEVNVAMGSAVAPVGPDAAPDHRTPPRSARR